MYPVEDVSNYPVVLLRVSSFIERGMCLVIHNYIRRYLCRGVYTFKRVLRFLYPSVAQFNENCLKILNTCVYVTIALFYKALENSFTTFFENEPHNITK